MVLKKISFLNCIRCRLFYLGPQGIGSNRTYGFHLYKIEWIIYTKLFKKKKLPDPIHHWVFICASSNL